MVSTVSQSQLLEGHLDSGRILGLQVAVKAMSDWHLYSKYGPLLYKSKC